MAVTPSSTIKRVTNYRLDNGTLYPEHAETDGTQVQLSATYTGGSATTAQAEAEAIRTLIASMQQQIDGQTAMYVVPTIAARDALTGIKVGDQAWVIDASADATVTSGAAKYIAQAVSGASVTWAKTAEAESMDVVVDWADVTNKCVDVKHVATLPDSLPDDLTDGGLLIVDIPSA